MLKKPVTGMKDILPGEMELREYVSGVLRDTYQSYGFVGMETPCVEHLSNLTGRQGGENEKLLFKILKRGEKLRLEEAREEADLADLGLRYDLTLPLARYYAANHAQLPSPFRAMQMGYVWRADRPQRGRYRQFMQCDIDILGEAGGLAEIDLISATSEALCKLGFTGFQVRINDRRILQAMASYCGFAPEQQESVFIALDKWDKIGREGVEEDLLALGLEASGVERYMALFDSLEGGGDSLAALAAQLEGCLDMSVSDGLFSIMEGVRAGAGGDFGLRFDPSLVRGMSYYTGPIFEISMEDFGGSVGGGGRYDRMVGRFTGQDVPACGFSIGFERIILLMQERGFVIPGQRPRRAYLIEKGIEGERLAQIMARAAEERSRGMAVLVARMNKNKKFQKEQLADWGYTDVAEFYEHPLEA